MSFLHVLKDVGQFLLQADRIAAPIVTAIDPPIGAAMNAIGALVVQAEQTYPTQGSGAQKKAAVLSWFFSMVPMLQEILKAQGFQLNVDQNTISSLIDATVSQLNSAATLKNAITITKLPQ